MKARRPPKVPQPPRPPRPPKPPRRPWGRSACLILFALTLAALGGEIVLVPTSDHLRCSWQPIPESRGYVPCSGGPVIRDVSAKEKLLTILDGNCWVCSKRGGPDNRRNEASVAQSGWEPELEVVASVSGGQNGGGYQRVGLIDEHGIIGFSEAETDTRPVDDSGHSAENYRRCK